MLCKTHLDTINNFENNAIQGINVKYLSHEIIILKLFLGKLFLDIWSKVYIIWPLFPKNLGRA